MSRREIKQINAGSMADIAFLLLIFFLVSTTMDTDTGIVRKLPPMPDEHNPSEVVNVKERNVFVVLVNSQDSLLVEGNLMELKNLRAAAREFIANPNNDPNLPAKETVNVPYFGPTEITKKHVISLKNHRGTSYEMYIAVQNELAAAYNELRDELARKRFGMGYADMEKNIHLRSQVEAINKVYNMQISEAEPDHTNE